MNVAWNSRSEVILLVDDESGMRASCRKILAAEGYDVIEADNGFEALILAAERHGHVDLLLTGAALPGISGARLAHAFEILWPTVPVLYLMDEGAQPTTQIRPGAPIVAKRFLGLQLKSRVDDVLEASKHSTIH
ncbi:MAG: response regulator [Candidatus Solibacter usitatus]|nr:response regulator [Candidatus Solibacter usitatus]